VAPESALAGGRRNNNTTTVFSFGRGSLLLQGRLHAEAEANRARARRRSGQLEASDARCFSQARRVGDRSFAVGSW